MFLGKVLELVAAGLPRGCYGSHFFPEMECLFGAEELVCFESAVCGRFPVSGGSLTVPTTGFAWTHYNGDEVRRIEPMRMRPYHDQA
jgi:hypothetical protein